MLNKCWNQTTDKNISVSSIYRPPNTNTSEFIAEYEKYTKKLTSDNTDTVIGLDHNLDLLKIEKHKHSQLQHWSTNVTKPTRITNKTATLLDNLIVNYSLNQNYMSNILIDDISDHLPCLLTLQGKNYEKKEPETIKYVDMKE